VGFFETLGNGLKAAAEHARKEQERQQQKYDIYSRRSDESLYKTIEGEYDDNFFAPSPTDKRIALKVLQDRYRR